MNKIIPYCSTIHSLDNLEHAQLIAKLSKGLNLITNVFLQIKLDNEKDSWIEIVDFWTILEQVQKLENIKIIWISGMWAWDFTLDEKENEFKTLVNLRDKYLPWKLISAWTSRDYEIALKYKSDVIRIGSMIVQ